MNNYSIVQKVPSLMFHLQAVTLAMVRFVMIFGHTQTHAASVTAVVDIWYGIWLYRNVDEYAVYGC